MTRTTTALGLAAALAACMVGRPARAETAEGARDPIVDRAWRIHVSTPSVRLNAYPLSWQMNGEVGVEFLRFNVVAATVSIHPDHGAGGGVGYLYQHTIVPRICFLQVGAFLGFWIIEENTPDSWDEHIAFFAPTARVLAGYKYVFFQAGFALQVGTSAIASFDLGVQFRV